RARQYSQPPTPMMMSRSSVSKEMSRRLIIISWKPQSGGWKINRRIERRLGSLLEINRVDLGASIVLEIPQASNELPAKAVNSRQSTVNGRRLAAAFP